MVVCCRNNCNFKASERSFRICQGNTPAGWRTVVQLLLYGAAVEKRGTSTQVAIIQKLVTPLVRNNCSVFSSLCSENSFEA